MLPLHFECSTVKRPTYLCLEVEGCCRLHNEQVRLKYGALVLLSTVGRSAATEVKNVKFNLVWFNGVEENFYFYAAEPWLCVVLVCPFESKSYKFLFSSYRSKYFLNLCICSKMKMSSTQAFHFLFFKLSVDTRTCVGGAPPTLL